MKTEKHSVRSCKLPKCHRIVVKKVNKKEINLNYVWMILKTALSLFSLGSWYLRSGCLSYFWKFFSSCLLRLRWGWVFLERTRILSGIQFTTHFIEFLIVETKRFVGSFVHVILTRQTCGQRSSKAAESKRRALGNYFSERIYFMILISKCRGYWDLGLCTTSGLAIGEPQRNGEIRFFSASKHIFCSEIATALRFSNRKSRSCAQT